MSGPGPYTGPLEPGMRVYGWVFAGRRNGYDQSDIREATVVRVMPRTLIIRTGHDELVRVRRSSISGVVDW